MKELPINFEQPLWLLLPILLVSIAISAFLYYRNPSHRFPKSLTVFLFLLRALTLFLLGVLLMNPYFVSKTKVIEKPKVVVAIDASESMYASSDSMQVSQSIHKNIEKIKTSLSHQFDIDILSFNDHTYEKESLKVLGKRTDMGQMLNYVSDKYYMLNMSALIVLSDGQVNQGVNPEYAYMGQSFSIYPMLYGDTTKQTDLSIKKLYYNSIIKQNSKFLLDVVCQAKGMMSEDITVQIGYHDRIMSSKNVKISTNDFTKEIGFELDIQGSGLQGFSVELISHKNEKNTKNNKTKFYVQVVETGNKVLLLGQAPHPDLGALASALKTSESIDVTIKTLNDYPIKLDDYQLIIMHGLPTSDQRSDRIFSDKKLQNKNIWYIVSSATDLNKLNSRSVAWEIIQNKGNFEHTEAIYRKDFSAFKWPLAYQNDIEDFPPLYVPFGKYHSRIKADVMLWQSIRGFETDRPLLSFWNNDLRKYALLSGEGIWKWRVYNFQSKGNHEQFNAFVVRVSNYMLTGSYDDSFNINYKNFYHESDLIQWDAQVYNSAFEAIDDAEVSVEITNENGDVYVHQFSVGEKSYHIKLDYLKSGSYSFKALAKTIDTTYVETGKFVVDAWSMEQAEVTANSDLMSRLAQISHGRLYDKDQVQDLINYLRENPDFKARSSVSQKLINLIDFKWLSLFLLFLVSLEWFLRKRGGAY